MSSAHLPLDEPRLHVQVDGQTVPLPEQDELAIGRNPDADIRLDDPRISRHHAVLRRTPDGWQFADAESSNGSFLDGQPVRQLIVQAPVELRLGDPFFGTLLRLTPVPDGSTALPNGAQDAITTPAEPLATPASGSGFLLDDPPAPTQSLPVRLETPPAGPTVAEAPRPTDADTAAAATGWSNHPASPAPPPPLWPSPGETQPAAGADEVPTALEGIAPLRVVGVGAIVLGLLVLVNTRQLAAPFVLVGIGLLALYVTSPTRLLRQQVVDRWDCLIEGAQGRGAEVMTATTVGLDRQSLPAVGYAERRFAASLVRGGQRPFLLVSQNTNRRLGPYKMYVSVRDYGTNLQASWFLIYHRRFFERLKPNPLVELNLFDEQDLRAYAGAVHHAFIDGVLELMLALGQDTARIDRSTKGFLGIS